MARVAGGRFFSHMRGVAAGGPRIDWQQRLPQKACAAAVAAAGVIIWAQHQERTSHCSDSEDDYLSAQRRSLSSSRAQTELAPARTREAQLERGTRSSVLECIGNTPLIELHTLSAATGCRILAKAEHLNPGGSVKDRPAASIIAAAEADGSLQPGGTIIEGTGGNTGVGMALVAAARGCGYRCIFTLPANCSAEKIELMRTLGAEVHVCPVVPFTDPAHYYHRARELAATIPGAVWGNQFEGPANAAAHATGTGPEIWAQAGGKVDALALAAGTGGTISGLTTSLRARNPALRVFVVDPPGSSLASLVNSGTLVASPGATITEGIGIGRLTANFAVALPHIEGAFPATDQEAIDMAFFLLRNEGLFVGPSAALNCVGAVKAARLLGPGHTVVTVLCDGGDRYRSKLFNAAWRAERGIVVGDVESDAALRGLPFVA